MTPFEEGYAFFEKNAGAQAADYAATVYVNRVDDEISKLIADLNAFGGFKTNTNMLKGDIAEFWHADTFNIDAVARGTAHRAFVDRSHDFASPDISSNFGRLFGLKYYRNGAESARQQSKSVFERYCEYRYRGGKEDLDSFLKERKFADDSVLHDPIYSGQIRVIPREQLAFARSWLEHKIAKEEAIRPDQVKRYEETLSKLADRLKDDCGTESIALSDAEAKALASLAKKGEISEEELEKFGISLDDAIHFEYLVKEAFKAGLTSATISVVLAVAPEVYRAIDYLIQNGELDKQQFQEIGFQALNAAGEGFVRGALSASITIACKSGMLGNVMEDISPSAIGMATVIALNTMKNAFRVAHGEMSRYELSQELIKDVMVSTCAFAVGTATQMFIGIPVVGFMLGSFIGSAVGAFSYNLHYNAIMSFCVDTGFTMFGLVKQDYSLPEDVLQSIGLEVFQYEKFMPDVFQPEKFAPVDFQKKEFAPKTMEIHALRRGVIGVSAIGYV